MCRWRAAITSPHLKCNEELDHTHICKRNEKGIDYNVLQQMLTSLELEAVIGHYKELLTQHLNANINFSNFTTSKCGSNSTSCTAKTEKMS